MFNAGEGFFHFVFANRDDDYYTPRYIKMKFLPFLRSRLIQANYLYIYIFGRERHKFGGDYWLEIAGSLSKRAMEQQPKKKRSLFSKSPQTPDENDAAPSYRPERVELDEQELETYLLRVLEVMSQKSKAAAVIPADVLVQFSANDEILKKLAHLRAKGGSNIIVVTSSVKASENDVYFKNTNYEYNIDGIRKANANIFYNAKIFPEIVNAFDRPSSDTRKLIYTYDALKQAFKNRMQVWNTLSYEAVFSAVNYCFLRSEQLVLRSDPKTYASVIWAWYTNEKFRDKYKKYSLPDNDMRSMREITEMLRQEDVCRRLDIIAEAEHAADTERMLDMWRQDDEIRIVRAEPPTIVKIMKQYKNVLRGHKGVLTDKEKRDLFEMIKRFSRTSYVSHYNIKPLPHMRFQERECREQIKELFDNLWQKQEWNPWDDAAMGLLFVMFDICYKETAMMCDSDSYNMIGEEQMKKCMDALNYCLRNSIKRPYEAEKACDFFDRTASVLRSRDWKMVKDYII